MEKWKSITGFEGLYEVSNLGNVRSLDRNVRHVSQTSVWVQKKKGRVINQVFDDKGYPMVRLHKDKKYCFKVHRLVAMEFLPEIKGKDQINHKDGNKRNNNIENLERCTQLENMKHAYQTGLATVNKPRSVQMLTLDNEVIKEFYSLHEAAREIGAEPTNITKVCKGERRTHKGYKWRYV